jgi:hypothetical protein
LISPFIKGLHIIQAKVSGRQVHNRLTVNGNSVSFLKASNPVKEQKNGCFTGNKGEAKYQEVYVGANPKREAHATPGSGTLCPFLGKYAVLGAHSG